MALRGQKPKDRRQRLKLLMYGPAGVGKTTAAAQMPRPYIIDSEAGSQHYGKLIEESGGAVFETTQVSEVVQEIRNLMVDDHPYLTLVIDPVTVLYDTELEMAERKVGTDYGKHYAFTGNVFKRVGALLTAIDMNVIVTAHQREEYETRTIDGKQERVNVGKTFDGWKKLDYLFDLVVHLNRVKGQPERDATVVKTRLEEFPDGEVFPWSYAELVKRYGVERLEKGVDRIELPTPEEVDQLVHLLDRLSGDEIKAMKLGKLDPGGIPDMERSRVLKGIDYITAWMAGKSEEVTV